MSCCGHCAEVLTTDYRTPAARKGKNMKNVKGTKNVGDRITAGMRQEIDAAKELQILIRLMGDPYDEAEKLLQMLDELEKCIPDDEDCEDDDDSTDDDDDDTADDSDSTEENDEELDDSWRDHVQGVFDYLMCPCSGIDSPDEFLENFEHYFWTGFPECKADEDDQDDPDDFDDEEDECGDGDKEEAEDDTDEDSSDDTDDFDDFLTDIIDALETVRDLYGKED